VVDRIAQLVSTQDEQLAMTPIRKIFDSVSEMSAHLARKKRIEVETCLEDDALAAPLRPQHMAQAVLNLVINAIEAAPSGGQVLLRGHGGDGGLVLEVENNGPGIPAREMDDLFQPFHTTKEQGTGLGLAITDTIVRDHGGRVTVQSGSNRTVFSVTLPGWDGTSNTESGESNGLERTACPDPDRG
jgi:signal transduction histidine kinase